MCKHFPTCPSADAVDHEAARVLSTHPEQGWSLLCNGVIVFEDTGALLPSTKAVAPHRSSAHTRSVRVSRELATSSAR